MYYAEPLPTERFSFQEYLSWDAKCFHLSVIYRIIQPNQLCIREGCVCLKDESHGVILYSVAVNRRVW